MVRQHGYSLIEVLVAVLVLSVGVLGVAGLQLLSLQHNTSSMYRTQAVQAAYDIIDRARANRQSDYSLALDASAPSDPDCQAQNCSRTQMRDHDLAVWRLALQEQLPEGGGSVTLDGGQIEVRVRWQDSRQADAAPVELNVRTAL